MTEYLSHIKQGAIGDEAIIIDAIADEAITMWSPVILVSAGTGEDLPRVEPTDTAADPKVIGVAVGQRATPAESPVRPPITISPSPLHARNLTRLHEQPMRDGSRAARVGLRLRQVQVPRRR